MQWKFGCGNLWYGTYNLFGCLPSSLQSHTSMELPFPSSTLLTVSASLETPPPFFQENLTVVWPYYCSPKKWLFLLIQTKTKAFRFPWVCAFANVSTPAWSVLLVLSFLFTKNLSGRNRFLPKWRPSYDHLSYIHINLQSTLSRYLCSVTLLLRQYTTLCPFKLFAEHIKQAFWDLS